MRFRTIAVIVLTFATTYLAGQDTGLNEARLKSQFEGKVVSLHHFYIEKFQRFDTDGVAKEDYPTCSWTMCGKVKIEKVSISKNKLKIAGRRTWVLFEGEPRKIAYVNTPEFVEIAIELADGPDRERKLQTAFPKIFLMGNQKFEDDLPDFWKGFFGIKPPASPVVAAPKVAAVAEKANESSAPEKPKVPDRVRVSQGVTEGLLIHKVTPSYPLTARSTHISGTVVLAALIDKQGNIAKLSLVKPVGAGLDEASYEGVKQWRYKPYYLQGQPVEVDTQITINFELRP